MESLNSFLSFIYDNWTGIITCVLLILGIVKKTLDFFTKTKEQQLDIAKKQIREVVLRLVTEAEKDYQNWISAGEIKRSQVIDQVFSMYPVLTRIADQESIIAFIDECIDDSLKILRKIIEQNETSFVITTKEAE